MNRRGHQLGRKYLYAVIAGTHLTANDLAGINAKPVHLVCNGSVAAVVSDISDQRIRPERAHLSAHQRVLKHLLEATTPLPMVFGVIADSPTAVKKILSVNKDAFLEQLQRVEGRVEMGLRVTLNVPVFEFFVNAYPELKIARDSLLSSGRRVRSEDQIELGRLFAQLLDDERVSRSEKVERALLCSCVEVKRNRCRKEQEVANLACLIARGAEPEFEAAVFQAANTFDNNFSFDYSGPWAPHNFVDLDLQL